MRRVSLIRSASRECFRDIVLNSVSKNEILRKLGYVSGAASYPELNVRLKEEGLLEYVEDKVRSYHADRLKEYITSKRRSLDDVLSRSELRLNPSDKKTIRDSGLLGNSCSACGIGNQWNDLPLTLQIDHVNGDPTDHRIENLRLLCPNCHSQTSTFGRKGYTSSNVCVDCGVVVSRNHKLCKKCSWDKRMREGNPLVSNKTLNKKQALCMDCGVHVHPKAIRCRTCAGNSRTTGGKRPSEAQLRDDISTMTWRDVGKKYGVSDTMIRRWVKFYNIPVENTRKWNKTIQDSSGG